ncbi:carbamoyltransferase C-terminal domain-containing protein [Actinosynnema sp. NPDC020468]|uniref:carbamoyltransferase family protein n=1 Tax=Actinosynnema sp. NPDC020468 TaxID=3154488 RepID=UPI0033EEF995
MSYVLGYSGLHGSLRQLRDRYPDADPRLLHLTQGLDSAAALVRDGRVVAAAAEERFTGEKGTGDFPVRAVEYCLRTAGITAADLDVVAHSFHYALDPDTAELDEDAAGQFAALYRPERQHELWRAFVGPTPDRFTAVPHHRAHAHSAVDLSGFESAVVIVSDGMGEADSMTVLRADATGLHPIRTVSASHSLGVLYSLVTHHLGFLPAMDEYKVMGLASFGDPDRFGAVFADLVRPAPDGGHVIPLLTREVDRRGQDLHEGALAGLVELFGPARRPGEEVTQRHKDIAAGLQRRVEELVLRTAAWARSATGEARLCLAGGVALNCTANGRIVDSGLYDEVFVQPAAGDDGAALGAALAVSAEHPRVRMTMPYWGDAYPDDTLLEVAAAAEGFLVEEFADDRALAARVAGELADGRILAWFQGGMEFGPRALGNRSILADPRSAATRDQVNRRIKKREDFRPFAPAAKAESAAKFFEIKPGAEDQYAHMVVLTRTRPEHAAGLGAVTHVNGTARVQTVRREHNLRFWELLDALEERIGVPVVLNTSFNVQGQPIVRTPREAVATVLHAGLDGLVLGRAYLRPTGAEAAR